jgi:S-adenosylmethionine decarboxylase
MPGESLFPSPGAAGGPGAAASNHGSRPRAALLPPKLLYAVDAALTPQSPVSDVAEMTAASAAAVRSGGGHVLSDSHVVFPNGALTLVLILAESHLAIHTWPEEDLIAIDLFSCGAIDGERVVGELVRRLRLTDPRTRQVHRG